MDILVLAAGFIIFALLFENANTVSFTLSPSGGLSSLLSIGGSSSGSLSLQQQAVQAAQKYGVPSSLFLGLIDEESGWNPNAVSPTGAVGLTQVEPATAEGMGYSVSDLQNNPATQLDAGANYLSQMYQQFGTWNLALGAYNAGPGAVQDYGGIPPYSQGYVNNINALAQNKYASGGG